MATNHENWKSLTNILLGIIGTLLMFFGSISVGILNRLYDKVDIVTGKVQVQENEQAHFKAELIDLKGNIEKITSLNPKQFAKAEDEDQFKPRSK